MFVRRRSSWSQLEGGAAAPALCSAPARRCPVGSSRGPCQWWSWRNLPCKAMHHKLYRCIIATHWRLSLDQSALARRATHGIGLPSVRQPSRAGACVLGCCCRYTCMRLSSLARGRRIPSNIMSFQLVPPNLLLLSFTPLRAPQGTT